MSKKIAFLCNTTWYIYNFRSNLIQTLINQGYEIIAISPYDNYVESLSNLGCKHFHVKINSKSKSPLNDIILYFRLYRIIKKVKPNVLLNFTAKPNIYGTLVGSKLQIPSINNIAGLGTGFVRNSITTKILKCLYKFSQKRATKVFFQNTEDQSNFIKDKIVKPDICSLLPGSGVDLNKFTKVSIPAIEGEKFIFLFVARMLYSKGVKLLYEAGEILYKSGYREFEIQAVGFIGVNSSDAIPFTEIQDWNKSNFFKYVGETHDVFSYIKKAHCLVLPSFYREGTPKSILEALAVGRPIITTDMPGCRTTVVNGQNGILIPPQDLNKLVESMKTMVDSTFESLENMGNKSRELAERKFDEKFVINEYQMIINKVLND